MTAARLACAKCGTELREYAKFCDECGAPTTAGTKPAEYKLPAWVTIKQAPEHYQVDQKTIRRFIAHGRLKARRIGTRVICLERESLLNLGKGFWE
jgi:predicted amidophosphoribosyltransferase